MSAILSAMLLLGNPEVNVEYNPPKIEQRRVIAHEESYFIDDRQKKFLDKEKRNSSPSQYFGSLDNSQEVRDRYQNGIQKPRNYCNQGYCFSRRM